jgi:hypothetical protein
VTASIVACGGATSTRPVASPNAVPSTSASASSDPQQIERAHAADARARAGPAHDVITIDAYAPESVNDVLAKNATQFLACHTVPSEAAHVGCEFTLDASGTVTSAKADGDSASVARCVEATVKAIAFGPQAKPGTHHVGVAFVPK